MTLNLKPTLAAAVVALLALGGCTARDRNIVALTLCERTAGCTTSPREDVSGLAQVRALENPRQASATAREK